MRMQEALGDFVCEDRDCNINNFTGRYIFERGAIAMKRFIEVRASLDWFDLILDENQKYIATTFNIEKFGAALSEFFKEK